MFDITVEYIPGPSSYLTDYLSRLPMNQPICARCGGAVETNDVFTHSQRAPAQEWSEVYCGPRVCSEKRCKFSLGGEVTRNEPGNESETYTQRNIIQIADDNDQETGDMNQEEEEVSEETERPADASADDEDETNELIESRKSTMATAFRDSLEATAWEPPLLRDIRGQYRNEAAEYPWRRRQELNKNDDIWYFHDRIAISAACPSTKLLVMKMFNDNSSVGGHRKSAATYEMSLKKCRPE